MGLDFTRRRSQRVAGERLVAFDRVRGCLFGRHAAALFPGVLGIDRIKALLGLGARLVLGGRRHHDAARAAIQRFAQFNGTVRIVPIDGPSGVNNSQAIADPRLVAHHRYRAMRGRLLLVRPDGHLACRAPLERPDIPELYLHELLHRSEHHRHKDSPPSVRPRGG